MDARAFFEQADKLPFADVSKLADAGGIVIVAPHPDDESLGCGALIAAALAEKRLMRIIVVSDGVGSHPTSRAFPPDRLRVLREGEARAAMRTLGLSSADVRFLALPDRFVPVSGARADAAIAVITDEARAIDAQAILVTWRHDPHGDHQSSYALAREAQRRLSNVRLFEYSIWGRELPLGRELLSGPEGWRLRTDPYLAQKRAAIACHRSQVSDLIQDDPNGFRLDRLMVEALIARPEVFLEMPA